MLFKERIKKVKALEEQILSFKGWPPVRRAAKIKKQSCFPWKYTYSPCPIVLKGLIIRGNQ